MIGATYFGRLADRIGGRRVFIVTIAIFSVGTGALIFTPDSVTYGWLYLTGFRFLIGFEGRERLRHQNAGTAPACPGCPIWHRFESPAWWRTHRV
jgi:MFS family permease